MASGVHAALFLLLISLLGVIRQQGPIDAVRASDLTQVTRLGAQLGLWWVAAIVISMIVISFRARRLSGPSVIVPAVGVQLVVGVTGLAVAVWAVRVVTLPEWFPGGRALPNYLLLALLLALISPVAGLIGSYAVALTLMLSQARVVADCSSRRSRSTIARASSGSGSRRTVTCSPIRWRSTGWCGDGGSAPVHGRTSRRAASFR